MTTLYFVRHAHSTYSPDERTRPLSDTGQADAKRLLETFQEIPIDRFCSSPYQRAIETIAPLAEARQKPIIEIEELRERLLAPGELDDFQAAVTYVWQHPDENPYGGETNKEASQRIRQFIDELVEKHPDETVVLGTHGNIMVLLLETFDPTFDYAFWKSLPMPAVCRMDVKVGKQVNIQVVPLLANTK
ncbi:histidine phosphatase family protein [Exiguobacterium acetylicum]|uniref:histidine phosphatase family protein n=1 Tax=Exiguobacterium acetylicum TaxID=41170 RepID=UPI00055190F3|nr:histidine phosphatase family protein [Exiguobacterium acetylicum]